MNDEDDYKKRGGGQGDKPDSYSGDTTLYKKWRRRLKMWMPSTSLVEEKRGPRLLAQLKGAAEDAVEHIEPESVAVKDGVDIILNVLDKEFGTDQDVNLTEQLETTFYGGSRKAKEELPDYIQRMKRKSILEDQRSWLSLARCRARLFAGAPIWV